MARKEEGVGYRNPPKKHQFKPGQSGNPNGRPKGRMNMKTLASNTFWRKRTVNTAEGQQQLSGWEILLLRLLEKGIKGDLKAIDLAITRFGIYLDEEAGEPQSTAEDAALLESYAKMLDRQRRLKSKNDE